MPVGLRPCTTQRENNGRAAKAAGAYLLNLEKGTGIVRVKSDHPFLDTVERLEGSIKSKGLTIFARIDFSGDAGKSGLSMHPTLLLVFGNPRAGTPVLTAATTSALDLPLKIAVLEDDAGAVWLLYNSPEYLQDRHGIPPDLLKNISGTAGLVESALK
jgi:uncharacterized protein (DUF302 family)